MNHAVAALTALAIAVVSFPASAQPHRNVYTLRPVEIVGRVRTPVAAIEVTRATVMVAPPALRRSFVERIDESVRSTSL